LDLDFLVIEGTSSKSTLQLLLGLGLRYLGETFLVLNYVLLRYVCTKCFNYVRNSNNFG